MAGNSSNLGQVSGFFLGTTPPSNLNFIWFDNSAGVNLHKIYNASTTQWEVLNKNAIVSKTYLELTNMAAAVGGLTVAQYFFITDKGNALALSITSTKLQYADSSGNIVIDDLGKNIQYFPSSSNLLIDDVAGVYDLNKKNLIFGFLETAPIDTDYILSNRVTGGVGHLSKFKINDFVSKTQNNSIKWNNGIYFDFITSIRDLYDVPAGVVSKTKYDDNNALLNVSINNVAKQNQSIIENANVNINNATTPAAIYGKASPSFDHTGEPSDILTGDTLINIVAKFQRFVNKFKIATGIKLSPEFKPAVLPMDINNNDTVDSAFSKVQFWLKNIYSILKLSKTFKAQTDPSGVDVPIPSCAPEDSLELAFSKLQGTLNDIGKITYGKIKSNATVVEADPTTNPRFELNMNGSGAGASITMRGSIELKDGEADIVINNNSSTRGITIKESVTEVGKTAKNVHIGADGIYADTTTDFVSGAGIVNKRYSAHFVTNCNSGKTNQKVVGTDWYAGLYATATNTTATTAVEQPNWNFGAYIEKLFVSGLCISESFAVGTRIYLVTEKDVYINCIGESGGNTLTVTMMAKPQVGQCIWIRKDFSISDVTIDFNGKCWQLNAGIQATTEKLKIIDASVILLFMVFLPNNNGDYWAINKIL